MLNIDQKFPAQNSLRVLKFQHCNFLMFTPRLCRHRKVTASPCRGQSQVEKQNLKTHSHSHSHPTTTQTLLGTPGEVKSDSFTAFRSSLVLVTRRTPDKTPPLPPESHRRFPIPLRTASKVRLWPNFINHTIKSVTLLHAFRSMHILLASSKPIFRSAHALST